MGKIKFLTGFKRICFLATIFCLIAVFVFADSPKEDFIVKSSADKIKLSQGQMLTFRVEISGVFKKSPEVKLPDLKNDFEIVSSGQSQSISISQEEKSQKAIFEYILSAKKAGKITIGEAIIDYEGKQYKTKPIEIEVLPSEKEAVPSEPQEENNSYEEDQGTVI